ncbi:hypothetical protein BESB_044990 [Besnoitia besnoiti]|uniref:ATP-dependent Clp protease proteolytic subunit n=1 Tax=Besnoitia besnoiti TaxID=94643 RepID=A0A2A9ML00_BESBE|nr:hypothetical protein BESB_044990 [Besnoitia besnoiti]PFH36307.1 hypothetical protein BESB_044990 [Besnoitia besnoiti]
MTGRHRMAFLPPLLLCVALFSTLPSCSRLSSAARSPLRPAFPLSAVPRLSTAFVLPCFSASPLTRGFPCSPGAWRGPPSSCVLSSTRWRGRQERALRRFAASQRDQKIVWNSHPVLPLLPLAEPRERRSRLGMADAEATGAVASAAAAQLDLPSFFLRRRVLFLLAPLTDALAASLCAQLLLLAGAAPSALSVAERGQFASCRCGDAFRSGGQAICDAESTPFLASIFPQSPRLHGPQRPASLASNRGEERREEGENVLARPPVELLVNCPGGSVTGALALLDLFQTLPYEVHTTCLGQAAGVAALLLAAGTPGRRRAFPLARISLRQIEGRLEGQAEEIEQETAEVDAVQRLSYRRLAAFCNRRPPRGTEEGDKDATGEETREGIDKEEEAGFSSDVRLQMAGGGERTACARGHRADAPPGDAMREMTRGKTESDIQRDCENGMFLSAHEAVRYGLIDEVISPSRYRELREYGDRAE